MGGLGAVGKGCLTGYEIDGFGLGRVDVGGLTGVGGRVRFGFSSRI